MGLREMAEQALSQTPEEKVRREEEKRRRDEASERTRVVSEQTRQMQALARGHIKKFFGVDAGIWESLYSNPTTVVLRDTSDKSYHKLALCVHLTSGNKLEMRYQPYEGYSEDHDRRGSRLDDWRSGPVVTDLESLGRAIKTQEDYDSWLHSTMPMHLP